MGGGWSCVAPLLLTTWLIGWLCHSSHVTRLRLIISESASLTYSLVNWPATNGKIGCDVSKQRHTLPYQHDDVRRCRKGSNQRSRSICGRNWCGGMMTSCVSCSFDYNSSSDQDTDNQVCDSNDVITFVVPSSCMGCCHVIRLSI